MRGWIRLLPFVIALLTSANRASADHRHVGDATLRAVQFIDEKEGWAAGDEGVIWHTLDGGQSWARQPTGVRASLRSVCFLNGDVGWVAGREELPHGGCAGVLLFTRDGGLNWQRLLAGALPGLNQVRFVDAANGFLLGDGTDQLPSGLFRTNDGGRTWEPVPGPRTMTWFAGAFADGKEGILAGAWARLGKLRADKFSVADDLERTDGRDIHGVHALSQQVIAVAQGGMVLTSVSGGARWGFASLKLPTDVLSCLDFNAVTGDGKNIWIVGRPGSVVLHSGDGGQTWRLQKTGSTLPLHGACFWGDRRGWAVGEAGIILATSDGGNTWQLQRKGGERAAVLVVQANAEDLPLDALVRLGAADGYLTAALRVVAPDPASAAPSCALEPMCYAAAARQAGGLSAETLWSFSLPQYCAAATREQVLDYWNRRHAQQAPHELLRQLVLALRIWRPGVVIGDHPQDRRAAGSLVAEALQEAVRQAADASAFPEQIETLGLAAWQVGKVYALCDPAGATVVHDNDEILDALQTTPRDHAAWAATLLPGGLGTLPRQRGYRLLQTQINEAGAPVDLMHGLPAKPAEARRTMEPAEMDADLAKALREKRQLLLLADSLEDPSALEARLLSTLAKLPEDHAVLAVSDIAGQYLRRGRWDLAHKSYALLVERYPAHPLAAPAYRWLIRHDGSSEVRRRYELKHFVLESKAALKQASGKADPSTGIQPTLANGGKVEPAALTSHIESRAWSQSSLDFGKRLAGFGPRYAADPSTVFCLQAARRSLGDGTGPAEWYGKFHGYVKDGPWHEAAHAELWLAGRTPQMPRKVARCRLTDVRPYLDGELDDPCWQGVKPLLLDNAAGDTASEYPTRALFAYDQEFLYIALQCKHPRGKQVAPVTSRPRDADVEPYDRVSILFDLDRDYATYFHLQIDQRGCVREDCWGELGWNPRWFVAIKSTEECWQVEAAIPLGELAGDRIALNTAWAFNVARIIPGRGVQSWSQPADVHPRPEGMTLLLFQQDADRAAAPPMPKVP
jgi:photosystem II stability/assembly factor-like uncharacterized protein